MHRRALTLFLAAAVLAAVSSPARAATGSLTLAPAADVGLPFWCDWSYDWEARCYTDDGARLPVGGVDDKVWRSALRFDLDAIPAGATVTSASLRLFYDRTCVAPRLTAVACDGRSWTVDAHRILSADWFDEREPDLEGHPSASATIPGWVSFRWVVWTVTALVRGWHAGSLPNDGVLLKLADGQEDYDSGGPYFLSSGGPQTARPRLVVTYTTSP